MEKKSNNWVKALSDAVHMVTSMAAAVTFCGVGGYYLDRHFASDPWFTIIGGILGISTAMKIIWDRINKKE